MRSDRLRSEQRDIITLAMGLIVAPLTVGAHMVWIFTGKRLPGLLDIWFGPPRKTAEVNLLAHTQRNMLGDLTNQTK